MLKHAPRLLITRGQGKFYWIEDPFRNGDHVYPLQQSLRVEYVEANHGPLEPWTEYIDFNMNDRVDQCGRDSRRWFPHLLEDVVHQTLGLVGEAGELANKIKKAHRKAINGYAMSLMGHLDVDDIAGELADVLVYTFNIANSFGIDIEEAYDAKRQFNERRFGSATDSSARLPDTD
jgi:NTP pyrophosphatase (non-canonical NTP hydrolase)